jgi:AraC-like DNA-binding protein
MLPQGPSHILRDRPGSPVIPWAELMKKPTDAMCPAGQETSGGDTALVSGYFRFELITANHNLFSVLPSLIHVRAKDGQTVVGLDETLKFVATESVSDSPGSQIVVARLMDVLFVQIIRALITGVTMHECQEKANICLALADPQVGKALALVHEHPNHLWTVATLASQVGMSRTAFAVRFVKLAGIAPLDYVRKWRMLKASELLRQPKNNIDDIAEKAGYESAAAFRKAFKRELDITPGLYRREFPGVISNSQRLHLASDGLAAAGAKSGNLGAI